MVISPRSAAVVLLAAGLAFAATGCSSGSSSSSSASPTGDTWRIGLEAPLSGDQATLGKGMLQGAQLAADQVNAAGGVLGKQLRVVPIDDAADPDTGVAAANAAIQAGLDGVVGPYNSGVGVKTLPLYIAAGVVPVRLTSDNSTDGDGITLQPMSNQIAPVTATALEKYLAAKSVGIIYDSSQNYTTSTSTSVKQKLEAAGVTVTSYEPIKPGQTTYSDAISQAEAKHPDVLYSAVYYPEGATIAKELKAQGDKAAKCLLDYASYDSGYVEDAGVTDAQACQVVGVPAPSDFKDAGGYVDQFTGQFGSQPGTWSPYTYDSLKLLVDEAGKAGTFDAKPLTAQLGKVSGWTGWTGSVTIDPKTGNRDPATVVVTDIDQSGQFHVDDQWAKAVGAPY